MTFHVGVHVLRAYSSTDNKPVCDSIRDNDRTIVLVPDELHRKTRKKNIRTRKNESAPQELSQLNGADSEET